MGTRQFSLGRKWLGTDNHSPIFRTKLRMSGTVSSLPICLHTIYRDDVLTFFSHTKLQILLVRNFDYHIRVRTRRMDENRVLRQILVSREEDEPQG
jgi:hypothetical protein